MRDEPEFAARYPQAYDILFPQRARRTEHAGLPLPSFGIRILRHRPLPYIQTPDVVPERDAYSATYLHHKELGSPRVDQSFQLLETGYLRGLLLDILRREEFSERIAPSDRDSDLLAGLDVPGRSAVRITDLRLRTALDPRALDDELEPALRLLERPITARRVVEWKHRCMGNAEETIPDPLWQEFGDRISEITRSLDREAWDELLEEMLEHRATHRPKSPSDGLTEQELESLKAKIAAVSFAAAALLLFIDLGMPHLDMEKPDWLAKQIKRLATLLGELASDLNDGARELEALLANRLVGHQPRSDGDCYNALTEWRLGRGLEEIAEGLGITPYSSRTGKGSRNWKSRATDIIVRGKEVEDKRYPRATAIFANYEDSPHIRRKAHRAYRAYLVQTTRMPGYYPLWEVGRKIRVNHQNQRGLEIIQAYIQLGHCLVRDRPTLP
ncbi:MAG: hypothetical protein M3305_02885 [Actinomycetota bacterium]|nr:hypothetical protein [Actinomycetota bacterium]